MLVLKFRARALEDVTFVNEDIAKVKVKHGKNQELILTIMKSKFNSCKVRYIRKHDMLNITAIISTKVHGEYCFTNFYAKEIEIGELRNDTTTMEFIQLT